MTENAPMSRFGLKWRVWVCKKRFSACVDLCFDRHMSSVASGLSLALCMSCFLTAGSPSLGAQVPSESFAYELEGEIAYETFKHGASQFRCTKLFKVAVRDCKWMITATDPETQNYAVIGYESPDSFRIDAFRNVTNGFTKASAIERIEVPAADDFLLSYLWMAYASGCYFDQVHDKQLPPIWVLDDRDLRYKHFKVPGNWESLNSTLQLPKRVSFFNDGFYRARRSDGTPVKLRAPPPYDGGYLNAEYHVVETVDVAGFAMPLRFIFTRYAIPSSPGSESEWAKTNLVVRSQVQAVLRRYQAGTDVAVFKPHFSGVLEYVDRRFAGERVSVRSIPYTASNSVWPEINDELRKKARLESYAGRSSKQAGKRAGISRLLLGFILLAPSLLLLAVLFKAGRRKTMET